MGYRIRLWIWDGTFHLIRQRPLAGVGIGEFAFYSPRAMGEALPELLSVDFRWARAPEATDDSAFEIGRIVAATDGRPGACELRASPTDPARGAQLERRGHDHFRGR